MRAPISRVASSSPSSAWRRVPKPGLLEPGEHLLLKLFELSRGFARKRARSAVRRRPARAALRNLVLGAAEQRTEVSVSPPSDSASPGSRPSATSKRRATVRATFHRAALRLLSRDFEQARRQQGVDVSIEPRLWLLEPLRGRCDRAFGFPEHLGQRELHGIDSKRSCSRSSIIITSFTEERVRGLTTIHGSVNIIVLVTVNITLRFLMSFFDLLFPIVLFVVQCYAWVRMQRDIAAGHLPDRPRLYLQTMIVQWLAFAVLMLGWWWLDRSFAALGMHLALGPGFAVVAVLTLISLGTLIVLAWKSRTASDEDRTTREALGDLIPVLPQNDRDLRRFYLLSFTAGVVEEVLYRGFVLWVLAQWMPVWAAVGVSSLAFGLAHGYQGASGVLRTGGIGLLLACAYVGSGSIWLPIVFHALFDVVQGVQIRELFKTGKAERSSRAPAK